MQHAFKVVGILERTGTQDDGTVRVYATETRPRGQGARLTAWELAGEGVLLDLASGMYFGLDETSTRLWQLINERGSLSRVFDDMLAEFDVDPDRLQQDILSFVAELTRRDLVSLASPPTRS